MMTDQIKEIRARQHLAVQDMAFHYKHCASCQHGCACELMNSLIDINNLIAEQFPADYLAWSLELMPTVLPFGWVKVQDGLGGGAFNSVAGKRSGLRVIFGGDYEEDGKRWLHVSASRANSIPSWLDMCAVKEIFIGANKTAYQVMPPADKHVNLSSNVLHLWHCVDGDVTPDFTHGGISI